MRRLPFTLLLFSSFMLAQSTPVQNQTAAVTATTVAAQAIAAFSPTPVSQIQLTGMAKAYAGSSQPSGTFTATLKSTGESTLQLNLAELTRTETTGAFSSPAQCQWMGADGVQHSAAQHNCLLPLHWLVPVLALQSQAAALRQSAASGTDEAVAVQTLSLSQPGWDSSDAAQRYAQLSGAKLSLDASTVLPTSLAFSVHPDNNERLDIPVVVRYSDYRQVSGATLPFHIQKYMNGTLVLDLQVQSAEVQ